MDRDKFWRSFIFLDGFERDLGCAAKNGRMVTVRGSKETGGRVDGNSNYVCASY